MKDPPATHYPSFPPPSSIGHCPLELDLHAHKVSLSNPRFTVAATSGAAARRKPAKDLNATTSRSMISTNRVSEPPAASIQFL